MAKQPKQIEMEGKKMPNITGIYTIRDGLTFNFEDLTDAMAIEGLTRAFNHVFRNECAATVTAAKEKAKAEGKVLTQDELDAVLVAAQDKKFASIMDQTWGSGARGPRTLAVNLEDHVAELVSRRMVLNYMAGLVKDNSVTVKSKGEVWTNATNGSDIPLARATEMFFGSPKHGEARSAARDTEIAAEVAARKAKAESRKA